MREKKDSKEKPESTERETEGLWGSKGNNQKDCAKDPAFEMRGIRKSRKVGVFWKQLKWGRFIKHICDPQKNQFYGTD